ncbi:hypothetical protein [Galactobacter valiniphilus]|uniref:hypothetical protein n=1 Tax=Galactobacter valiniphilus TaxID=2676122 RepID=UPI003735DA52
MAKHEAHTPEPDDASRAAGGAGVGGGGAPTLDAQPVGFLGGGAHRGGAQEFVVLTDAEEPPEELAGARPAREAGSKRRWIAGGVAAGLLVAGFFVWTLPGSGALETQGGGTICAGSIGPDEIGRSVEFSSSFTNYSSLPVTVTDAGVQQLSGLEIVDIAASVTGESMGPSIVAGSQGKLSGTRVSEGAQLEVPSGRTLVLTFRGRATGTTPEWLAQASEVRVDYHSWTQAPHRSVDSFVAAFTTGKCPE